MTRIICRPKSIDAFGVRLDGGLDLVIVANGAIDARAATRQLLLEKLANYFAVYRSSDAASALGFAAAKPLRVVLVLPEPAGEHVEALLREVQAVVQRSGKNNVFEVQVCAV